MEEDDRFVFCFDEFIKTEENRLRQSDLKKEIINRGAIQITLKEESKETPVLVFNSELATILLSKTISVTNADNGIQTELTGFEILKIFVKGYLKAVKVFREEYGSNAPDYIKNAFLSGLTEYEDESKRYPFGMISYSGLFNSGFASGYLQEAKLLKKYAEPSTLNLGKKLKKVEISWASITREFVDIKKGASISNQMAEDIIKNAEEKYGNNLPFARNPIEAIKKAGNRMAIKEKQKRKSRK